MQKEGSPGRLGAKEFTKRFLKVCEPSHKDSRLKGPIISVLARTPSRWKECPVIARVQKENSKEARELEVVPPWWLVIRTSIWQSWAGKVDSQLGQVRILLLEDVAREFGGEAAFNNLVRDLVSFDYFRAWVLHCSTR
jgi:hypothetical protein